MPNFITDFKVKSTTCQKRFFEDCEGFCKELVQLNDATIYCLWVIFTEEFEKKCSSFEKYITTANKTFDDIYEDSIMDFIKILSEGKFVYTTYKQTKAFLFTIYLRKCINIYRKYKNRVNIEDIEDKPYGEIDHKLFDDIDNELATEEKKQQEVEIDVISTGVDTKDFILNECIEKLKIGNNEGYELLIKYYSIPELVQDSEGNWIVLYNETIKQKQIAEEMSNEITSKFVEKFTGLDANINHKNFADEFKIYGFRKPRNEELSMQTMSFVHTNLINTNFKNELQNFVYSIIFKNIYDRIRTQMKRVRNTLKNCVKSK